MTPPSVPTRCPSTSWPGLQRVWLVGSPGLGGGRLAAWPGGHLVGGLDFVGIGVRFGERRGGVSEAQRVGGMMRVSGVWHCEGGFGAAGQDWAGWAPGWAW